MNDSNKAAIAAGTATAVLVAVFRAPLWGSLLAGAGAIFVTKVAIANAA